MMNTILRSFTQGACALAVSLVAVSSAFAAHVEYGDFTGTTVMYLDVEEVATTPGDAAPLYGEPEIIGNKLDFDPGAFSSSAAGGSADLTDGQLNFTLMAAPGSTIETISLREGGDYTLFGLGTAATRVGYGISLGSVVVTELNGSPVSPIVLSSANAFGSADLISDGPVLGASWGLALDYVVDAALLAAGHPAGPGGGATKIEIAINNTLSAISEPSTTALIVKKDFMFDVSGIDLDPFDDIPEPTSMALVGLALCGLGLMGRRQG